MPPNSFKKDSKTEKKNRGRTEAVVWKKSVGLQGLKWIAINFDLVKKTFHSCEMFSFFLTIILLF